MHIKRLTIHNIGIVEHTVLEIDKALNLFYGDIRQGKTTILNAVRWCFGGEFPADIIRHGQDEAHIEIVADDDGVECVIRREWYVNKEGETTNRPLTYYRNGAAQQRPAETLKAFLNPFILNDRYFSDLTLLEQRRFLVRLFGIDTRAEDAQLGKLTEEASQLRLTIKAMGDVFPVECQPVDVSALLAQREQIIARHDQEREAAARERERVLAEAHQAWCAKMDEADRAARLADEKNRERLDRNGQRQILRHKIAEANAILQQTESDIAGLRLRLSQMEEKRVDDMNACMTADLNLLSMGYDDEQVVKVERITVPEVVPDVSSLDAVISSDAPTNQIDLAIHDAGAANERHKQYLRDCDKRDEKAEQEGALIAMEREIAALRAAKVAKLKSISESCGVPTLEFTEAGDYLFDGTTSAMLSDSQQMELSEHLKGKYPDGLAVSLVDRGESLGRSVMKLVERAQQHNRTILCTVVGDKPAVVPEDVGAFVVEKGVVK